MKKILFWILLYSIPFAGLTQPLHVTFFAGASNYQGDLQDKRFTYDQSHLALGAGFLYEIVGNLSARANITVGTVSGNDRFSPKNSIRNLSFSSRITDLHLGLEYNLVNINEHDFAPYLFVGISYFHFNPTAIDSFGRKNFLQPLGTEGQGFYQGRKKYKLNQLAIPFGGGIKFAFSEKVRLAVEVGLRKTSTDYLDDVSTNYVDQLLLLASRGPKAVELAFRSGELKTGLVYPVDASDCPKEKMHLWVKIMEVKLRLVAPLIFTDAFLSFITILLFSVLHLQYNVN
jgi:Domain of unknown function (DUF6089)